MHLFRKAFSLRTHLTTSDNVPATHAYQALCRFDTVFLIDDSPSMSKGDRWKQTKDTLAAIAPVCTERDPDGIDIHFLNDTRKHNGVKTGNEVMRIFSRVSPAKWGGTPTGKRLGDLLQSYMDEFRRDGQKTKPLNIICITDGEPTDPTRLEQELVDCAKELDSRQAQERQIGVQFIQVGDDKRATDALETLDNCLPEKYHVRDMVDTISWKQMNRDGTVNGDALLKAVMGAIDGKLDRKRKF
jgi:hypothetical protein